MTEADWLACASPQKLLDVLRLDALCGKADDRKLRLFACACCRWTWRLLTDPRSRRAVEVAERFADGLVLDGELEDVRNAAWDAARDASRGAALATSDAAWAAARVTSRAAASAAASAVASAVASESTWGIGSTIARLAARVTSRQDQAALLRDIVGNPFRPAALDPALLVPAALSLARAAYEARGEGGVLDPVRLCVLADALEEAGADDSLTAVLREPGPHFRGLWALDLVLGKG